MDTDSDGIPEAASERRANSWRQQVPPLLLFLFAGAALIGLPVLASLWLAPLLWPQAPQPWMPPAYDANLRLALVPALFFMQTLIFPRMTFRLRLTAPLVLLATAAVQGAGLAAWWSCGLLVAARFLPAADSPLTFAAVATAALAATGVAVHLLDMAFARGRLSRKGSGRPSPEQ